MKSEAEQIKQDLPYIEYTVKAGDSLASIAKKFNTNWRSLVKENELLSPYTTVVGQKLTIGKPVNEQNQTNSMSKEDKEIQSYRDKIANTAPTCNSQSECDTKMEAAYLWVTKNADYKIRNSNNVVIETYAPREHSGDIFIMITKEPLSKGKYVLIAAIACHNPKLFTKYSPITSCKVNTLNKALEFNDFVNSY
ncbi:LysM peptidoglycan-binding domain-containing protein [Acinetobacter dispersus]|nr:LysM peptidoglycan-binding domain-containing protein [Acinetobacter dispersus]